MKQVYIYGASGHGKVVAEIAYDCDCEVLGYIDDDEFKKEFNGKKVYRFEEIGGRRLYAWA